MVKSKSQTQGIAYPPRSRGLNFFAGDRNLRRLLERRAGALLVDHGERLDDFGAWAGGTLDEQAAYTDRYAPPALRSHDPVSGTVLGAVVHNPAYLECHQEAYRRGVIGLAFEGQAPHLLSFVMGYLLSHSDISIHCPVTMTGAVAYVLQSLAPDELCDAYLGELTRMDGRTKSGATWATELHGGSDVGATTTEARPDGGAVRLQGLKWFTSNAGAGLALATARPVGAAAGGRGLGCYLVPDELPDGTANAFWVRRLKDKAGTRGLATGEIELNGALALEVAAPPDGLKAMMEALAYSRIHNAFAACGAHRRAFLEAACWATHRQAFGSAIVGYPMVRDSLLDLLTELEAGVALAFEAAVTFDAALADPARRTWLRVATALAKYRTAEKAVTAAAAALELVGGNGYTEDWPTARLYRDVMVLAVWEGPANVQALELLRLVGGKATGDSEFLERIEGVVAALPGALSQERAALAAPLADCRASFAYLRANPGEGPRHARRLMARMADLLSAALLLEEAADGWSRGDARKAIVARRFIAARWAARPALGAATDPAHQHFEALIGYTEIAE